MATVSSITRTQPASVSRLQELLSHVQENELPELLSLEDQLSTVAGPTEPPLANSTLAELLTLKSLQHRDDECMVFVQSKTRWTYGMLEEQSQQLARGLLALGVEKGDRIGIMSGNCEQYVALFFAVAKVGAILVVINNTYSSSELLFSLEHTGKMVPDYLRLSSGKAESNILRMQITVHRPIYCPAQQRRGPQSAGSIPQSDR